MARTTRLSRRNVVRRSGFTLVEMLLVLAIVLIVVALIAAGTMQVLSYHRSSVTEWRLKTVSDSLDRQWRSVVDSARKESLSISPSTHPGIYCLASYGAGQDPQIANQSIDKRARVIYVLLRLKQEFPQNVSEAIYPWAIPVPGPYPPGFSGPPVSKSELPPRVSYVQVLSNAGYYVPAAGESPSTTNTIPASLRNVLLGDWMNARYTWPEESSIMILLSLQQGRGGPALTEDDLGAGAVTTDPISGLKGIIDAWERPIYFYRWQCPTPYSIDPSSDPGNANNRDADNNYAAGRWDPTAPKTIFRDPIDPEGVLLDPDWNNASNYANRRGVWWFELYCHSVHEWDPSQPSSTYQPRAYYNLPTLESAGRNGRLGFIQPIISLPTLLPPGAPFPSPLLPDTMVIDPADSGGALDNIFSYRLRQGARGD